LKLKLVLVFVIGVFLISNVFAFEFDNVKNYNLNTKEVRVTNAFGLGDDIAKIKLDTPLVYNVIRGEDRLVAEFTIDNFEDYSDVFNKMEFYNVKKNMENFDREFNYKYKTFYDINVSDYETICKEREVINKIDNETYIEEYDCYRNQIGSHIEQGVKWNNFNERTELPKGEITLGIFTDVYKNEEVEWIPTLFGVEINEWATWNETFEEGLLYYYGFDETSGDNAEDLISGNDFTGIKNSTIVDSPIDGKMRNFTNGEVIASSDSNVDGSIDGAGVRTINIWAQFNQSELSTTTAMFSYGTLTISDKFMLGVSGGKWNLGGHGNDYDTGVTADTNFNMHTVIYNGTDSFWYLNGTLLGSKTMALTTTQTPIYLANNPDLSQGLIGSVDELGIWNRTLSQAEITDLYNEGDGIFYPTGEADTEYPQFSTYWDDNTTLEGSGIGHFNVTVESTNGTVLLEINNTNITATNFTSNVYNVSYTFIGSGVYPYKWHSFGNGTNENYNGSELRSYTVNITYGTLNVEIQKPDDLSSWNQYDTNLTINATVTCIGGDCGTVSALARYNLSADPDTAVNITEGGEPFYILGGGGFTPTALTQVGAFANATSLNGPREVEVIGNYAYITSSMDGSFTVLDITDKTNPTQVGYFKNTSSTAGARGMGIVDNYAYVGGGGNDALTIINITDPTNLTQVSSFVNSSSIEGNSWVDVLGNYAYVTSSSLDSLAVINVTDKTNPTQVGYLKDTPAMDAAIYVAVLGNYVYVTATEPDSLTIINVTDKTNPNKVGYFSNSSSLDNPRTVEIVGDYAYTGSCYKDTIAVINITNKTNPTQIGAFKNSSSIDCVHGIVVSGNYAYATSAFKHSVTVINITDKTNPTQVSSFANITSLEDGFEIDYFDGYVIASGYVADGISIIKVGEEGTAENPQSQSLSSGESYQFNWTLNVTTASASSYLIDVLFNSTAYHADITANNTADRQIFLNPSGGADITSPTFITIPSNASLNYNTDWSGVFFNATDETTFDTYHVNDTRFTVNDTGYLINSSDMAYSNYLINVSINDTSNNMNHTLYHIQINQSIGSCQVYFNETSPQDYLIPFTVMTNCSSAYILYRNGTIVSNNSDQLLEIGSYNFTAIRTDNLNYSNIYDDEWFTVSKIIPSGSLSGTSPITYGTAGDVEGTESNVGDSDVTYSLYRNGTNVSNPDTSTLAVGFYSYIYNNTAGTNYSANVSLDTFDLTVNPELNIPNITISTPTNITYTTTTITFNVTAVDDTLMDSCWYSLDNGVTNYTMTNTSSFYSGTNSSMTQGQHTVNFYCNDSSNNLNDTEEVSFFIDSIYPLIDIPYPTNITYGNNVSTLNYTYVETNCNYTWYTIDDGVTNSTLESCGTNFTGIVSSDGLNTWIVFVNDTAGNLNSSNVSFTLDLIKPTYSGQQVNTTIAGNAIEFGIQHNDNLALHPNGQYIFSTNNTGDWVNESSVNWTSTPEWANVSMILNSTAGLSVGYRWFVNDSIGNVNNSDVFILTTTDIIAPIITVQHPTNITYNTQTIWFNATSSEDIDTWIINYNGTNITRTINTSWVVEDGNHHAQFWASDISSNFGLNDTIHFSVDTTAPQIAFESQTLANYSNVSQDFIYANVSLTESNFEDMSYNLYSSSLNTDGLVLYLPMDRNSTTQRDISGEGNDGTVSGVTWTGPLTILNFDTTTGYGGDKYLSTENMEGQYSLNVSTGVSQYNQITAYTGIEIDVSSYANDTNMMGDSYLTFWVWFEDVSLISDDRGIATLEFGNVNNQNQSKWSNDAQFRNIVAKDGWNYYTLNFNESTYMNLDTINWSEIDYIEFYAKNNSATKSRILIDDLQIHYADEKSFGAYEFDDIDIQDKIKFGDEDSFEVGNHTFSLWVNPLSVTTSQYIMDHYNWRIVTSGTTYRFTVGRMENVTGPTNSTGNAYNVGSYPISVDEWTHLVGVYSPDTINGHGFIKFYANGVLNGTIDIEFQKIWIGYGDDEVQLGNSDHGAAIPFNGSIDEVMIFNRSLSQTEITNLYNRQALYRNVFTTLKIDINWTSLLSNNYNYYVDALDTGGLFNFTEIRNIKIDYTPPYFITIPNNDSLIYNEDWGGVFFNVSDETAFDTYLVNDTRFTINSTGYLLNSSDLAYGSYLLNITINDTSNNINWTNYFNETSPLTYPDIFTVMTNCSSAYTLMVNGSATSNDSVQDSGAGAYNYSVIRTDNVNYSNTYDDEEFQITKSIDSCQVYFNETSPLTYPDIFTVMTNCSSSYTLAVNGSATSNDSVQDSGAGAYNYSVIRTDNVNYSNTYDEEEFQILVGSTSGSISGTSPITYGTTGNVEGTESNDGDGDVNYRLYRDGVRVNNPDVIVLAVGYYSYIYNSTEGENYTDDSSLDTFNLEVIINVGDGTLTLNGTTTNKTIYRTDIVLIEGTLDDGTGNIYIFINDTLFDSGGSPLSDTEVFNTLGYYVINLTYLGNENYTSFVKYLYVEVTANPFADINITYPLASIYTAHITNLNYTVVNYTNCWYNLNEGGGNIPIACGTNITGISSIEGSNTWVAYVNNTDGVISSSSVTFTINLPYEYDDLTKNIIQILQALIIFASVWVIMMTVKWMYEGEITLGRLIVVWIQVGLGFIALIFLGPIAIKYIISVII